VLNTLHHISNNTYNPYRKWENWLTIQTLSAVSFLLGKKNRDWDSNDVCRDAPKDLEDEELRELEELERWIREQLRKAMKMKKRGSWIMRRVRG